MVTGKRGADMTAVVSAKHAARTRLTGATGLLIVVAAFVMMAWAAPPHPHAPAHRPAAPRSATVTQLESHLESQAWPGAPGGPRAANPPASP